MFATLMLDRNCFVLQMRVGVNYRSVSLTYLILSQILASWFTDYCYHTSHLVVTAMLV
jgi:hypothetical protein